jgi:hypothetical protein
MTCGKIALAWAVLLFSAALILPNLSLQMRTHTTVKIVIAAYWVLLLIGTPISLIDHFRRAWKKAAMVPNRTAYVTWLGLETACAAVFLAFLLFATIAAVVVSLR